MTTAASIITDALRVANVIAVGASPTTAEQTEALERLNKIIQQCVGSVVGYELENWKVVTAASVTNPSGVATTLSYVLPNSRLICRLTTGTSLALDPYPEDGQCVQVVDSSDNFGTYNLTLTGNGNTINNASSLVFSTNGTSRLFMYRADAGDWVEIVDLATAGEVPFPEKYDDYFITKLAMRLNPSYGRAIAEETKMHYAQLEQEMIARYRQSRINVPTGGSEQ